MRILCVLTVQMMMWALVVGVGLSSIFDSAEAQSAAPFDDKEIYGADDRHDVFEEADPVVRALADSVAGLFYS